MEESDGGTGRVPDALKELKVDGNTQVIFMSDNGPWSLYGIGRASSAIWHPATAGMAARLEAMGRPFNERLSAAVRPLGRITRE